MSGKCGEDSAGLERWHHLAVNGVGVKLETSRKGTKYSGVEHVTKFGGDPQPCRRLPHSGQGTGREKLFFHKQYCRLDFKIQLKIVSHPEALSKANYQSNQNV
jgi:hypothetical protein